MGGRARHEGPDPEGERNSPEESTAMDRVVGQGQGKDSSVSLVAMRPIMQTDRRAVGLDFVGDGG